jgi:hypothetical protein
MEYFLQWLSFQDWELLSIIVTGSIGIGLFLCLLLYIFIINSLRK